MGVVLRDLHSLDDFRRVVALEEEIWGMREETVPVTVLAATVPRGAVLVGAFDGDELAGFAYAFPALSHGRLIQWSHMTGVASSHRGTGLGFSLKCAQRARVQAMRIDRVDWTFDPLQAANAHFNLRRLGAVVEHYEVNTYGELANPLHGGIPTDRFVAQWWIDAARVCDLLDGSGAIAPGPAAAPGPPLNPLEERLGWMVCDFDVSAITSETVVQVAIPPRFTEMLAQAPDLALEWRLTTRRLFQALLSRRYRVLDFVRHGEGGGAYVLEQAVG